MKSLVKISFLLALRVAQVMAVFAIVFSSCKKDDEKFIKVGEPSKTLWAGVSESLTLPIEANFLPDAYYEVTDAKLPEGITVWGGVTIKKNTGNVTLKLNGDQKADVYKNLTLTISGVTSKPFTLTVVEPTPGTEKNPFKVGSVAALQKVGSGDDGWTLEAHYVQTDNINFNGSGITNWTPIGEDANRFTGTYNGDGYSILNLKIDSQLGGRGLFGYIGTGGVVKNLALIEVSITADADLIGGVVGHNLGGTIQNCYVTGNIKGNNFVGGVVGAFGTVENCYTTCNVSGIYDIGGVVGHHSGGVTLQNCYATRNASGGYNTGGVVGYIHDNNTIKNCVALNKEVKITEASIGRVVGLMYENAGILTNNYGRSGMTITENGAPVTITEATGETTSGKHGASISVDQWHKKSWWIGTAKFLEASWDLADGRLPHLKTDDSKAFNQTQTPKVE